MIGIAVCAKKYAVDNREQEKSYSAKERYKKAPRRNRHSGNSQIIKVS